MTNDTHRAYVDTRIGQLHVTRSGSGPQIVLLPAASQSHNAMRRLMAHLASSSFEVVVLDTPGSGYSDPLPAAATFSMLADAVVDAIRALELKRPCLYGIHTGNKIAASAAARYDGEISALVFCGQTHSLVADQKKRTSLMRQVSANRFQTEPDDPAARLRTRLALWREIEDMWWRDDLGSSPPSLSPEPVEETRLAIADLLLSIDSLPQLYTANFAYDLEADLRRIGQPALIIEIATPHEDRAIGRQGEILKRVILNAELVTFEEPDGLGLTLENRADAVAAAVGAFLASIDRH